MDLNHVGTRDSQQLRVMIIIMMTMKWVMIMVMMKWLVMIMMTTKWVVKLIIIITSSTIIITSTVMTMIIDHPSQNELEARVGLMGGDSLEEADKSWWERNKSWITILIFVLIILATIIVIIFIGFGGLNAT